MKRRRYATSSSIAAAAGSSASAVSARPAWIVEQRLDPALRDREVVRRPASRARTRRARPASARRRRTRPSRTCARGSARRPRCCVRVGFMLPSNAERSRKSRPVAHSTNRHAASLVARHGVFITTDHVQRFGRREPVGPSRRRRVARSRPTSSDDRRILEVGDVVVGVDDQAVAAVREVERELVPALVGPVDRPGGAERGEEVCGRTAARRARRSRSGRPRSRSAPYDQSCVAKPVYIVCQASVPRCAKPRTPVPVRDRPGRGEVLRPRSAGTSTPASLEHRGHVGEVVRLAVDGDLEQRPVAERRRRSGRSSGCRASSGSTKSAASYRRSPARGTRRAAARSPRRGAPRRAPGPTCRRRRRPRRRAGGGSGSRSTGRSATIRISSSMPVCSSNSAACRSTLATYASVSGRGSGRVTRPPRARGRAGPRPCGCAPSWWPTPSAT